MKRTVHVALIQFESIMGDVNASIEKAIPMITAAADQGAQIICLPELFSTGYNLRILGEKFPSMGETVDGPTIQALQGIAKEKSVYIIAPIALYKPELPGVLYNSAVLITDEGKVEGVYDKNHLWALERFYFRSGDDYPVFNTRYGRIGIMICYDAGFPEVARILTCKGAEIIFCPSAWCHEDMDIWHLNMPQRALENSCYVCAVNRFGQEGDDLYMSGYSMVCNPRGKILAHLTEEKENTLHCTLDLDDIVKYRNISPYLRDRRPEQYQKFL